MRKVFSITVDNASANGAAIEILRDDFQLKGIILLVGGSRAFKNLLFSY